MDFPAGNQSAVHGDVGNIVVQDSRRARGGKDKSHQQLQGRCFSGAVRPEKTKDLALVYRQRQSIQRANFSLAQNPTS